MKKLTTFFFVLTIFLGCSSQRSRTDLRSGYAPLSLGGGNGGGRSRLGAVISKVGVSCSMPIPGLNTNGLPPTNTGMNGNIPNQGLPGSLNGGQGILQVLSLNESELVYVNPVNGISGRSTNSSVTSGIGGVPLFSTQPIPGISSESQVAYNANGGLIFVTIPEQDTVLAFPAYDRGGLGSPYRIRVVGHPTEISVANTPFGEFAVVTTRQGLAILAIDRINVLDGSPVPSDYLQALQVDIGAPTAVAFSPDGSALIVATNPTSRGGVAAVGGRVTVYDFGVLSQQSTTPRDVFLRGPLGRGWLLPSQTDPYFHYGIQLVNGLVTKLVANSSLVVALSGFGPTILNTPNVGGMTAYPDNYNRSGNLDFPGTAQANLNYMNRNPRDVVIHPGSNNIIVLNGNKILTYPIDEIYRYNGVYYPGRVLNERVIGINPVALAMDPDKDPRFMLVADNGAGSVKVLRLNQLSFRYNDYTDFIQVQGCPVDVAIQRATYVQNAPVAANSQK